MLQQMVRAVETGGGDAVGTRVAYASDRSAARKARDHAAYVGVAGAEARRLETETWSEALPHLPSRDAVPTLLSMCLVAVARQPSISVATPHRGAIDAGAVSADATPPTLADIGAAAAAAGAAVVTPHAPPAWPALVVQLRMWRASQQARFDATLKQRVAERELLGEVCDAVAKSVRRLVTGRARATPERVCVRVHAWLVAQVRGVLAALVKEVEKEHKNEEQVATVLSNIIARVERMATRDRKVHVGHAQTGWRRRCCGWQGPRCGRCTWRLARATFQALPACPAARPAVRRPRRSTHVVRLARGRWRWATARRITRSSRS